MPIATAGTTNRSEYFYIVGDASNASPGDPVTGLLFSDIETGGSASYMRQGAARVDLTLITQTVAGAHADGGFIEVDATNMPGVYRCDFPDAAYSTGVDFVVCQIVVAAANNAIAAPIQVDLTDVDLRDSVRAGLTALPNVNAGSAGGVATDTDANGAVRIVDGTGARELNTTSGSVDLVTDAVDTDSLAANAITDIWAQQVESEGTYTAQQVLSICLSALAGITSNGGATLETPNGVANRIVATVNASNERTAMTLTPSS